MSFSFDIQQSLSPLIVTYWELHYPETTSGGTWWIGGGPVESDKKKLRGHVGVQN
jgi:hypothetical protein